MRWIALLALAACGGTDPLADLNKPCVVSAQCAPGLDCTEVGLGGRRCVVRGPNCPAFTDELHFYATGMPDGSPSFCVPKCGSVGLVFLGCAYGVPCEPTLHICSL